MRKRYFCYNTYMSLMSVKYIWLNGELVPWKKAQMHMLNFSFHYGASAFEGIRFYDTKKGPKVFRLNDHLKRLAYSAGALGIKMPYTTNALYRATHKLIVANKMKDGYLRPIVFFGYGGMGISAQGLSVNVMIAAWPWERAKESHPLKVKTSSFVRIHPRSTRVEAKLSGHYVNSVLAFNEARDAGYDDALMLDADGFIAECAVSNIFMVKGKKIITPKLGAILPGITRDTAIELLKKEMNLMVQERKIRPAELKDADEVFSTGTAHEITPIVRVDRVKIGNGEAGHITKTIAELYSRVVHGEFSKYNHWLA